MKVVVALFGSLNRKGLELYGGQTVAPPTCARRAARGISFDCHDVGSMPCMPARRDRLPGRLSFPDRSREPSEPFDDVFPELLVRSL